jgi:disulfide oxidoreductase YuzD
MTEKVVEISIFGAEEICASCVNLPSSIDTYEWLQAAISRKYPNQLFNFTYTDIFQPSEDEEKNNLPKK